MLFYVIPFAVIDHSRIYVITLFCCQSFIRLEYFMERRANGTMHSDFVALRLICYSRESIIYCVNANATQISFA